MRDNNYDIIRRASARVIESALEKYDTVSENPGAQRR
jgi:hypothetical protein